jgi:hypothetical protein
MRRRTAILLGWCLRTQFLGLLWVFRLLLFFFFRFLRFQVLRLGWRQWWSIWHALGRWLEQLVALGRNAFFQWRRQQQLIRIVGRPAGKRAGGDSG